MIALPVELSTGNIQACAPDPKLRFWGFSAAETAATTAACTIRHGRATTDPPLAAIMNFAASGYIGPVVLPNPVPAPNGIFIHRSSGTTALVLYVDYQ